MRVIKPLAQTPHSDRVTVIVDHDVPTDLPATESKKCNYENQNIIEKLKQFSLHPFVDRT